jgi:hypothetical protein
MSFLKKLFGGSATPSAPKSVKQIDYNGYTISAEPYPEGGQYQVAGTITRTVDGVAKTHRFVRADRFGTESDAADVALNKGRQIIDQQGDTIFA